MPAITVPALPKSLGYLGLMPFVILAGALWLAPSSYQSAVSEALLAYGAVILSFMGAIHWGLAIRLETQQEKKILGYSVVPALMAWLALLIPELYAYSLLLVAFVVLCIVDSWLTTNYITPTWYPTLRIPLTAVVVASIILAQVAIVTS